MNNFNVAFRFKFEYESDVYIKRRNEKIRSLIPVSRKQNSDVAFKGYFCGTYAIQNAKVYFITLELLHRS